MKLDERFMTIITALLLTVAVGAVLQGGGFFGDGDSFEGQPDSFTLRAGRVQPLDVLLNDRDAESVDPASIVIDRQPQCGSVTVDGGLVRFSDSDACEGVFTFSYCVPAEDACPPVEVTLTLIRLAPDAGSRSAVAAAPANTIAVDGSAAPQQPQQMAANQPMRLSLPDSAEVMTPAQATESIRRIPSEGGPAVNAENRPDTAVTVSTASARSGAVATSGASMTAPAPAGESAGVALATGSDAAPARSAAPMQPPMQPSVAGLDLPAAVRPGSIATANPDTASAAPGPVVGYGPAGLAASAAPDPVPAMPVAMDVPRLAQPARLAKAAPDQGIPASLRGQSVAVAGAEVSDDDAPATRSIVPVIATAPEPASDRAPELSLALSRTTGPRTAPSVDAPAAVSERGAVAAGPDTRVAPPPVPESAVPSESPELAGAPQLPGADPVRTAARPAPPAQVADLADAPDATMSQVPPPPPPPENGVLASLARSNTVLGAAVSAAKALFAPSEPAPARQAAPVERAAAPAPVVAAPPLVGDVAPVIGDPAPQELASLFPGEAATPLPGAAQAPDVPTGAETAAPAPAPEEFEVAALPPAASAGFTAPPVLALPPIPPAGTGTSEICEVNLALQVQVGAEIIASLSSPCRPQQRFLVDHAGLVFTAETDLDGVANFVVPAMETNAVVRVQFPDGGSTVHRATVEGMSRMTRIAVVWTDDADFDLHAREYGAAAGSDGDVWAGNPRNYRLARRQGGGYLTLLGPSEGPAVRAEVYTLFRTLRTDPGEVALELALSGDTAICDTGPVIRVLRSEGTDVVRNGDVRLAAGACDGAVIADAALDLSGIRIAARD